MYEDRTGNVVPPTFSGDNGTFCKSDKQVLMAIDRTGNDKPIGAEPLEGSPLFLFNSVDNSAE